MGLRFHIKVIFATYFLSYVVIASKCESHLLKKFLHVNVLCLRSYSADGYITIAGKLF
jgi:hypothetical protein